MKPQAGIWVAVIDGGHAQIYRSVPRADAAHAIEPMPEGRFEAERRRLHPGARPGKNFANARGDSLHAVTTHEGGERLAEARFIANVAEWLSQPAQMARFDHLILVAPPRPLGEFRMAASKALAAKITREIRADLTGGGIEEVERHVRLRLTPTHAVN